LVGQCEPDDVPLGLPTTTTIITVIISQLPNIFTALTAHLPSADDNSMIGCTTYDSTDDWS